MGGLKPPPSPPASYAHVCGLRREAIQRKLLTCEGLTLKTAYETAYGIEAAELRAGELQKMKVSVSEIEEATTVHAIQTQRIAAAAQGSACYRQTIPQTLATTETRDADPVRNWAT